MRSSTKSTAIELRRRVKVAWLDAYVSLPVLAAILTVATVRPSIEPRKQGFRALTPAFAACLLFIPLFRSDFLATLLGKYGVATPYSDDALTASLSLAILWCLAASRVHRSGLRTRLRHPSASGIVWMVFLLAAALQLLSWRLVTFNAVTANAAWSTSADPVFYELAQVVQGRTLLVDLPSQYGLFPEFLAPLFHLITLSVFSVSAVMAVLQMLSLTALFHVLSRLVKSRALCLLTGLALLAVTFLRMVCRTRSAIAVERI